jgi:flagellar hook-associated protein 2
MGTVGLNFGSATSGQGFDVSSTVAQIVSNLQNVEKPWKTQLTTLQSQDTTISSLGTLFSNLSNDMSTLTDFTGTMSQKLGSSSDQNVLTLSAATSAAVAGTHVVTVSNLAQTSSGYLARIANASDPLSGSITLQAGNGSQLNITLNSSNSTLAGLAQTINSSGVGITASVLTDSTGSLLSLVSNTSGAGGNITVSNNSIAARNSALNATVTAGANASGSTSATASSSTLTGITNPGDLLTGSIKIQVGNGTEHTVAVPAHSATSPSNNLTGLAGAINGTSGIGVTASVVTNSDGTSSLKLVSNTTGTASNLTVTSSVVDTSESLAYTSSVTGTDASLTVDGVAMTSSSNTVANLIPGVTFQLLAPSATVSGNTLEQVQVVIANDNAGVESTMSQMVSDYNSLISAVNAQEGLDSSNNAEPLFGSPTLSLLQQQLLSGLNLKSPSGTLTSIASNTDTTLAGSISIQEGSGTAQTFVMGAAPPGHAENMYYTGSGVNTLAGLADAINAASQQTTLNFTDETTGNQVSHGALTGIENSKATLSGSLSVQVGTGTAETIVVGAAPSTGAAAHTIYTGSGVNSLSGLASAINDVSTTLHASVTVGTDASGNTAATTSSATLTAVAGAQLTGSLQVLAGQGTAENIVIGAVPSGGPAANTLYTGSGANTLSALASTIDGDHSLGLSAAVTTASNGTQTLTLTSGTSGSAGTLIVTPSLASNLGFTADVTTYSNGKQNLTLTSGASGTAGTLTVSPNLTASGTGFTANVITANGQSTLALNSQIAGSSGALTVTSGVVATSATPLTYTDSGANSGLPVDIGTLTGIPAKSDALSGSITIQVGDGVQQTIKVPPHSATSPSNNLSGLAGAINSANINVNASVIQNSDGTFSLQLQSETLGSGGDMTVTSNILDTTNTSNANLSYTSSSDINNLTSLGISVSNNGSLSLDAASLDSVLNSDYTGVVGFFQNASSWGQTFSTMLTNAGTSSPTGILALATTSNSNTESTLNADISREDSLISAQQKSLTAELNTANQILQALPSELDQVNELYSAITGYNKQTNG